MSVTPKADTPLPFAPFGLVSRSLWMRGSEGQAHSSEYAEVVGGWIVRAPASAAPEFVPKPQG